MLPRVVFHTRRADHRTHHHHDTATGHDTTTSRHVSGDGRRCPSRGGQQGRAITTTLRGTPDPEPDPDAAAGVGLEPAPEVVEGELLSDEQAAALARRRGVRRWVPARVVVLVVRVRRCGHGALVWRGVLGATGVLHVICQGFASWGRRAWDAATLGAYRRQIKAAEALGDRALLAEWTQRREQAAQARHQRLLELPALATGLVSVAAGAVVGLVVALLVLGLLVWLSGAGSVLGPLLAALTLVSWACTFIALIWTPAVASIPVWCWSRRGGKAAAGAAHPAGRWRGHVVRRMRVR